MENQGVSILNGERIKGFVKLELFDKDGNKKVEKDNFIVPGGKTLMFRMSASEMLVNGGNIWGLPVKQGAHIMGVNQAGSSNHYKMTYKNSALTNVLLNLTDEQKAAISSDTNFVNMYSDDFGSADKVVAYANIELYPAENGKIGTPDYTKGADIVGRTINSVRYKYKDGVGTGTINAIAMAPFSTIQSPYGLACVYEQYAPGYRLAKCLDRVNFLDTNFSSFTTKYTPPGVTGVTTEEEIITNYSINGINYHKINLVTGEVTDLTDTNVLYGVCDNTACDFKVIDDYLYVLRNSGTGSSGRYYFYLDVYQISTATLITSSLINSYYAKFAKLLYLNDVLYITIGAYSTSSSIILHKLGKGSNNYFNVVDETATTYAGILTAPAGVDERYLSFGHYGDKYIMYISRALSGTDCQYCTGYIFTDIANITGSIVDCIPSLRYTDIPFGNSSVSGVLSIGICRENSMNFDSMYNARLGLDIDNTTTYESIDSEGMFYSPDKSWSNIVSVVVLDSADIIEKGATDVLYVTYGYKIV